MAHVRWSVAVLATVVMVSSLSVPTLAGAAPPRRSKEAPTLARVGRGDALSRALTSGRISEATYALERATSLFSLRDVARRFGDVVRPDPRLASVLLRDLAVRVADLSGLRRERANDMLARPDDSESNLYSDGDPEYGSRTVSTSCDTDLCVHWVSRADYPGFNHAATNAFAGDVFTAMQNVWATEIDTYGYRPPKDDTNALPTTSNGGGPELDVYLGNIGGQGLFGYCTSNDAKLNTNYTTYDFSAYCVLDNNYSAAEFPGYGTPLDPMKVTAAHEFFHASQFAYDALEDVWFMEGTAAWMEDEVYDAINDNYLYLATSPLSNPTVPIDKNAGLRIYGSWIWWRFLAEYYDDVPTPLVIREIWERADGSAGGADRYSTQATRLEIEQRGQTFGRLFADFAAWNTKPQAFYDEGDAYDPVATQQSRTISGSSATFTSSARLDHLTSRYVVLNRGIGVHADAKLRIVIDGPPGSTSPEARAVLFKDGGVVTIVRFGLNDKGRDTKRVDFGSDVHRAIVIVSNASTRFTGCYDDPNATYSCWGTPVDDDRRFEVRANLSQ